MSLRSISVTPRSLAARRSNALKSTGPRTRRGKARVCLNALKHGRYAVTVARSARLREKLLEAGHTAQEAVYSAVRSRVAQAIRAQDPASRREIDEITLRAWCLALRTHPSGTKLERPLDSGDNKPQVSTESRFAGGCDGERGHRAGSQSDPDGAPPGGGQDACESKTPRCRFVPRRYSIVDRWTRTGMVFWCQRRPSLPGWPRGYRLYEGAVRCLRFKIAKPGVLERARYKLLANGDPDWTQEPWRKMKGDDWKKWPRPKDARG